MLRLRPEWRAHARPEWRAQASSLLAGAVLLALGLCLFTNTGHDDAHITYGAALNLLRNGSITSYNGQHLEQSSSLAHVVLTALTAAITRLSVPLAGHLLGIVAAIACLPLVRHLAARIAPDAPDAAPLFVATTPSFLYWSFGGLESAIFALAALATTASFAAHLRRPSQTSLALAFFATLLLAITRPEGALVAGCAALGLVAIAIARANPEDLPLSTRIRPELALLAMTALAAAVTAGLHLSIGGHVFPNPVSAKVHGVQPRAGLVYLATSVTWRWSWVVLPLGAALFAIARRARSTSREEGGAEQTAALLVLAYLGFIVLTGGDWMSGGRFLAHVAPLVGLLIVAAAARYAPPRLLGLPLTAALLAGNALAVFALARQGTVGRPIWTAAATAKAVHARYPESRYDWFELANSIHRRDVPVGEELRRILPRVAAVAPEGPLVVASGQAGFIMYHTLENPHPPIHYLDLYGITSDEIHRCAGPFLVHNVAGAVLSYKLLLSPPEDLTRRCHLKRPDVIFDLIGGQVPDSLFEKNGYTIVYFQRGYVRPNSRLTPSIRIAREFIAVDAALAKKAGLEATTVEFDLP